jgi:hypothetical protein
VSLRPLVRYGLGVALLTGYVALFWRGLGEELGLLGPEALLLALAAGAGLVVGALRPAWLGRVRDAIVAVPTWLFLAGSVAFALLATHYCVRWVHGFSMGTPDEATYAFQARMLAAGHLFAPAPPHHEFFQFRFCLQEAGRWFGIFPPGWPAILAVGVWLGELFWVNAVLGGLLVLLTYVLARELVPGRPTVWRLAVVLGALSIIRMAQSASLMSHVLGAVCTTTALWAGLRAWRTGRARWLLLVGAALGLQADTRLLNAFALGLPALVLTVAFAWRHRRAPRRVLLGLGALGAMVALFGGLQLAYNARVTGAAFRFPQRAYFAATEHKPHCSDPGFGADRVCTHEHPPGLSAAMPRNAFYPRHGVRVTYVRLDAYSREAAGGVVLFAFLIVGLLAPSTRRAAAFCLLGYGSLWLAYGTFYYHGLAYGARYYFEATACVWIGVALGLAAVLRPRAPRGSGPVARLVPALGGAAAFLVLLLLVVLPLVHWPVARSIYFRDLTRYHEPVERAIAGLERAGIKAVVAHPLEWGPAIFNRRPWDLAGQTVIVAHDVGTDSAEELLRHFPGRRLYRWNQARERLEQARRDPDRVVIEPELFFPVDRTRAGYAQPVVGGGIMCLKLFGERTGAQAEIRAHFPRGRYEARPTFISGPDAGRVRLEVDGQPVVTDLDLYFPEVHQLMPTPRIVDLRGDQHLVRMTIVGKSDLSQAHTACLDRLVFDRAPAVPKSQPAAAPAAPAARP